MEANKPPVAVEVIAAQEAVVWDLDPEVAVEVIAAQAVGVAEVASAVEAAMVVLAALVVDQEAGRAGVEIASCHGGASAAFAWTRSSI